MSRLIDADAITKETFVNFVGDQEFISFNDALWMISEQPTAYDIDKVVEQLQEISETFCKEYALFEDENILYLPDAIEIVKGGADNA